MSRLTMNKALGYGLALLLFAGCGDDGGDPAGDDPPGDDGPTTAGEPPPGTEPDPSDDPPDDPTDDEPAGVGRRAIGNVFIAVRDAQGDHALLVFEPKRGNVIERYPIAGPAVLRGTRTGRYAAAAIEGEGVRFFSTGYYQIDHGDHLHTNRSPVRELGVRFDGVATSDVLQFRDQLTVAISSSEARWLDTDTLYSENADRSTALPVGGGAGPGAVPLHDRMIRAFPADRLTVVSATNPDTPEHDVACEGDRTALVLDEVAWIGCGDALYEVSVSDGVSDVTVVRDDMGEVERWLGFEDLPWVVAVRGGSEPLAAFDRGAGQWDELALPDGVALVDVTLDLDDGEHLLGVFDDGTLRTLALVDGTWSEPFAIAGVGAPFTGNLAWASSGLVYVSDPENQRLIALDWSEGGQSVEEIIAMPLADEPTALLHTGIMYCAPGCPGSVIVMH